VHGAPEGSESLPYQYDRTRAATSAAAGAELTLGCSECPLCACRLNRTFPAGLFLTHNDVDLGLRNALTSS
jgi:hypothetical protein